MQLSTMGIVSANRVNAATVWAGVQTNNGLKPGAVHGAEIGQAGGALVGGGCGVEDGVGHFYVRLRI